MDSKNGGPSSNGQSRKTAAEIARAKVLAAYNSDAKKERKAIKGLGRTAKNLYLGTYKDTPIDAKAVKSAPTSEDLKKYHSAWQNYYQKYYSDYYSKVAKSYLENEKLKTERRAHDNAVLESPELAVDPTDEEEQSIISTLKNHVKKRALAQNKTSHRLRRFIPLFAGALVVLLVLFLQYNRLVFAPIMAYVSPGNSSDTGISAIDPTITTAVGADNRLIIPKLNVDVPVNFGIANDTNTINMAMENGVAQFSIPGASAMPGEIGNLVITGHSAGDIYSNNQYKFIFSGLERLGNNDLIYIDYQGTRYTYSVIKKETVEPSNVGALIYDTDKPMLTLITCTPLGTSRYRLLVTAEQISPAPSGATQSDTTSDEADAPTFESMPENEPTFFERIWRFLTGQN